MVINIKIYPKTVNCDRYHLLKPNSAITGSYLYSESGITFNGFDNPVIVNTSIENIFDSRIASITISQFNDGNEIYCLIRNFKPITANKTAIYLEIDGWMNYRNDSIIGLDNYLFETSKEIDYPFYELTSKSKLITKTQNIEDSDLFNVIILYHNTQNNEDVVYYLAYDKTRYGFGFYSIQTFIQLNNNGVDTNNIIGIYLSPFDINTTNMSLIYELEPNDIVFNIYRGSYRQFIDDSNDNPKIMSYRVKDDYIQKTIITDMTGSPVWTSIKENDGAQYFSYKIDLRYDGCSWNFSMSDVPNDPVVTSPNKRFSITCVDLAYFVDYYQQFQNTVKSYNNELRQAQLDKQLIDNIGGIVSSTTSGAVGGMIGGMGALGAVSGAVGGIANTITSYYSTSDYNRKLESIEDRQSKVQYDTVIANSNSYFPFLTGETIPCFNQITIDIPSQNSGMYDIYTPYLKYNCRIKRLDLIDLVYTNTPLYLSGDFDFVNMNQEIANQLNERFKHGVYFVNWTGGN